MVPGLEHRRFRVKDGTEIGFQHTGRGPAVVLCNGLGGTVAAWTHVLAAFGGSYRLVSWDYRGLYSSARPRDRRTLTIEQQVEDLVELLDLLDIRRAVLVGWSMGVQVSFEAVRHHADRITGIVAIAGTYGTPLHTLVASWLTRWLAPAALQIVRSRPAAAQRAAGVATSWPGFWPLLQRMRVYRGVMDPPLLDAVGRGFATMDFEVFTDLLLALSIHDARDVLPRIACPVLVLTGTGDVMTPVSVARRMTRAIPGARLVVVDGATHYLPIEVPGRLITELRYFLAAIPGWEAEKPLSTAPRRETPFSTG